MNGCILVTGGSGFIGSHTTVRLIESGYHVLILDNFCNSSPKAIQAIEEITGKKIPYFQANIEDTDRVNELFKTHSFEAIIHFGNLKSNADSIRDPGKYYKSNIGSMFSLLQLAERYNVTRFIFSSSATVYGSPDEMPVKETYPVGNVLSPYGLSKYLGELYLADYAKKHPGFKAIALRYFNPVGAHQSGKLGEDSKDKIPVSLIPYITKVMLGELDSLKIYGNDYDTRDGTGLRDYVHVMDVAEGHVAALKRLERQEEAYDVFNLGTGKGTTVLEIVRAFEKTSGLKIPYEFVGRRPGDVSKSFADISKAKKLMKWAPIYSIDDCARDAWNWQKTHPFGFDTEQ